jgi:hypothetical protein
MKREMGEDAFDSFLIADSIGQAMGMLISWKGYAFKLVTHSLS